VELDNRDNMRLNRNPAPTRGIEALDRGAMLKGHVDIADAADEALHAAQRR
jgi:hypothetical protein